MNHALGLDRKVRRIEHALPSLVRCSRACAAEQLRVDEAGESHRAETERRFLQERPAIDAQREGGGIE